MPVLRSSCDTATEDRNAKRITFRSLVRRRVCFGGFRRPCFARGAPCTACLPLGAVRRPRADIPDGIMVLTISCIICNIPLMQLIETIPKLKPRAIDAHKGDFGKVLIIAGSMGMSGAAALAGRAALRAGAGLVRVATPKSVLPIVASIEPSFTTIALPEDSAGRISAKAINTILDAISENDAVAFGPGVGVSGALQSVLETLLQQENLRLVIDADGLNNLS